MNGTPRSDGVMIPSEAGRGRAATSPATPAQGCSDTGSAAWNSPAERDCGTRDRADAPLRCFIAVRPSSSQRRAIADRLAALRRDRPAFARDLRFVRPDDLHVTLAFLAAVPANEVDTLIRAASRAAAACASFAFRLDTLGGYPRTDRARVAWLRPCGGTDELTRLARTLRSEVAAAGLPVDDRAFRPHLTVARARRAPVRLPSGVSIEMPTARVIEIEVVRSDLTARGAEHRVLARAPLAGNPDQSITTSNVKTVSDR